MLVHCKSNARTLVNSGNASGIERHDRDFRSVNSGRPSNHLGSSLLKGPRMRSIASPIRDNALGEPMNADPSILSTSPPIVRDDESSDSSNTVVCFSDE